jgi:hypothetical protein
MQQRLVYLLKNRQSFLLKGDDETEVIENRAGEILPWLLANGWKVVSISMTASAAVNDDQVLGIAVLENS